MLCLYQSSQPQTLLAQAEFQDGIARIDLNNIQWPSDHMTYFERHFPSDDPYHPNETIVQTDIGVDLYEARTTGYTYKSGNGQSQISELIRDGATATAGNVQEPYASNTPDPNIILPRYATGFTWAESAWMGLTCVSWQTVVIGDPLMSPYAPRPAVVVTSPSAEGSTATGSITIAGNATASAGGATAITRMEASIMSGLGNSTSAIENI